MMTTVDGKYTNDGWTRRLAVPLLRRMFKVAYFLGKRMDPGDEKHARARPEVALAMAHIDTALNILEGA